MPIQVSTCSCNNGSFSVAPAGISIEQKETYPFPDDIPEGRWAVYEVQLLNRPTDAVTLQLAVVTPVITLSHDQLIFHPDNWNTVQDITVFAVDDDINRASPYNGSFSIKSISYDKNYDDVSIEDFVLSIEDNDEGTTFIVVTDILMFSLRWCSTGWGPNMGS